MTGLPGHDSTLPRLKRGGVGGRLRRLGAALFALILAFLASVAHVSHTCQEGWVASVPIGPGPDETGLQLSSGGSAPPTHCLACMFLHGLRSTLAAAIVSILSSMPFHDRLCPFPEISSPSKGFLSGVPIRAPPLHRTFMPR